MQTNSEIYQVEDLKYRITDPTNKWVEVVGKVEPYVEDVIIPSSITIGGEEYKVTSIGKEAFKCSGLLSIAIPSSVISIGDGAFSQCSILSSIHIPSSVISIGKGLFSGCEYLTQIKVAPYNPVYDSRNNCNAIIETKSNTLIQGCAKTIPPSSVTSIGDKAFENCKKLRSITLPSSVTSIGDKAFTNCSKLTSITIPSSVTSIGEEAFSCCYSLRSITLPSSVTSIGRAAFAHCESLTSINISNSVTSIGERAFSGCKSLTSITIPSSVTSIGERAFYECKSLTSITIPSSVTSIGDRAFDDCKSLTSITIPTHFTNIYELDIPVDTRIIWVNVIVSEKLESHYNQGVEFHKLAEYDQAFEYFKRAATNPYQFAHAYGEYAELLNGVYRHIMNNEMQQAHQAYNIYTKISGRTCSIVETCLKAGGIPKSMKKDDGHAGAQYYVGLYYERGYSVQKDFAEAIKWYRRAAEKGHQMAKEMLEYMVQQLG